MSGRRKPATPPDEVWGVVCDVRGPGGGLMLGLYQKEDRASAEKRALDWLKFGKTWVVRYTLADALEVDGVKFKADRRDKRKGE